MLKEKKKCEDLALSDSEAITIMWYWHKGRHTYQWNRIKSSEIELTYMVNWFSKRCQDNLIEEIILYSINYGATAGYSYRKIK